MPLHSESSILSSTVGMPGLTGLAFLPLERACVLIRGRDGLQELYTLDADNKVYENFWSVPNNGGFDIKVFRISTNRRLCS